MFFLNAEVLYKHLNDLCMFVRDPLAFGCIDFDAIFRIVFFRLKKEFYRYYLTLNNGGGKASVPLKKIFISFDFW